MADQNQLKVDIAALDAAVKANSAAIGQLGTIVAGRRR